MEDKQKKSKKSFLFFFLVGIILFFLVSGILVGMAVLHGVLPKGSSPVEQEEEKVEGISQELSVEDVAEYDELFKYFNNHFGESYPFKTENLSNQDVLEVSWILAVQRGLLSTEEVFTKEDMKQYVSYVFGSDYSYTDENIPCFLEGNNLFQFDGENYQPEGMHGHGGHGPLYRSQYYFQRAWKENGKLIVQLKVLYAGYCGDTCGPIQYYYAQASRDAEPLRLFDSFDIPSYDDMYVEVSDQLPITTFTFQEDSKGGYGIQTVDVRY